MKMSHAAPAAVLTAGLVAASFAADTSSRPTALVDKILTGANPGGLLVEQPARFELMVDLRAAKALGPTTPQSLPVRVAEVIQ